MPRKPSQKTVIRKLTKSVQLARTTLISAKATISDLEQRAAAAEKAAIIQHDEVRRQDEVHETGIALVLKELKELRTQVDKLLAMGAKPG